MVDFEQNAVNHAYVVTLIAQFYRATTVTEQNIKGETISPNYADSDKKDSIPKSDPEKCKYQLVLLSAVAVEITLTFNRCFFSFTQQFSPKLMNGVLDNFPSHKLQHFELLYPGS